MDAINMLDLGRILLQDRLREAERRRRWRGSEQFVRLPKLVQALILALF
jgi:hypothetical protein